jgi:hypothetical protein
MKRMVRILLVLFSIIIFSVFQGHFTSAKAQETGTLSVTTTPVSGAIYVDNVFKGTKFWRGDLNVGSHVVSFGYVDGYIAPSPQTVTVITDQTYYTVGAYRKLFSLPKSDLISSFWIHFDVGSWVEYKAGVVADALSPAPPGRRGYPIGDYGSRSDFIIEFYKENEQRPTIPSSGCVIRPADFDRYPLFQ